MRALTATTALTAFGLVAPALADEPIMELEDEISDHEIALEIGALSTQSETYRSITGSSTIPTYGLRGGMELSEAFTLVGSYHHAQRGGRGFAGEVETDAALASALYMNQLTVGLRADWRWRDVLELYASGSVVGFHALLRLDDHQLDRNNPAQVSDNGFSVGAQAMAGVAVVRAEGRVRPVIHLEGGWTGILPHSYATDDGSGAPVPIGSFGMSSPTIRAGAGIRF